jgi:hypothetical protein
MQLIGPCKCKCVCLQVVGPWQWASRTIVHNFWIHGMCTLLVGSCSYFPTAGKLACSHSRQTQHPTYEMENLKPAQAVETEDLAK